METLSHAHGVDQVQKPFLEEAEIPIDREDIRIVQGLMNDPDVIEFENAHPHEMRISELNVPEITKMSPQEAVVYKILLRESVDLEKLVGLVPLIKKGMEFGSVQIAYVLDNAYQNRGIASASVNAVTQEVTKRYDIVANIGEGNKRSVKLAKKLGYYSFGESIKQFTPYYKNRQSRTRRSA
jgi:RimJ/RimL family protein N-acetyltransferase